MIGYGSRGIASEGQQLKFYEPSDKAAAETEVKAMCDKLLANTVIESYRVELA